MLIAHTYNGLANRLRCAVSSIILAEYLGRECRIIWPCNQELDCPFYDLFQRSGSDLLDLPGELRAGGPYGRNAPKRLPRTVTFWQDWEHPFRVGEPDSSMHPALTLDDADLRKVGEILYIRGCHEFRPAKLAIEDYHAAYARILCEAFRPCEDILSALISLPPRTIGVHVRRGDKYKRLSRRMKKHCSDLQNYLPRLTELLDSDPSRNIFVASDDDRVKDDLRAIWSERVTTYPDVVQERDSVTGVKHALRDLYTLGKSSIILTDGNSTFGPLAARYENRPHENMRKDFPTRGPLRSLFVHAVDLLVDRPSQVLRAGVVRLAGRHRR